MAPRNSNRNGLVPAVIYLRMSNSVQEKSIPEQRIEVERYAADNGYRIVREYVDEAISGDAATYRVSPDACRRLQ